MFSKVSTLETVFKSVRYRRIRVDARGNRNKMRADRNESPDRCERGSGGFSGGVQWGAHPPKVFWHPQKKLKKGVRTIC